MSPDLREAVLARLGVRPTVDLAGLGALYAAWCRQVPFDNLRKLVHLSAGAPGPLPGSTADDFFAAWLAWGTGGTCWAGNGALHALLADLGFAAERVIATMTPVDQDPPGPTHGSVAVTVAEGTFLVDASILSGRPLLLVPDDRPPPRVERRADGRLAVLWRTQRAPDGMHCRVDRIGASAEEWDALHQRTAAWSPFNFAATIRVDRGDHAVGYGVGHRYVLHHDGRLQAEPADRGRVLEELGIDAAFAARVPHDRPAEPPPGAR